MTAERWFGAEIGSVWRVCTSKRGLESWWSPEDLRTVVQRLDLRRGGEVAMTLRYVPAMAGPARERGFRAAGIPVSLQLRGRFLELAPFRRVVLELTLTIDRAGAGITNVTQIDLVPEGEGTRVRIVVAGKRERHMVSLGEANLEGQLERIGRALEGGARPDPVPT